MEAIIKAWLDKKDKDFLTADEKKRIAIINELTGIGELINDRSSHFIITHLAISLKAGKTSISKN
jgi:hypothetical protein